MPATNKKELSPTQSDELISLLKIRFEKNKNRHVAITWTDVEKKLSANPAKLWILNEMEHTGGEPDVIGYDAKTNEYLFVDCAAETPKGRRSTAYDKEGQFSRKEHIPTNNAIDMAAAIGIEILNEEQYR
ncbi:MAG: DUF4256 family protein, partial [Pedobacter sp.]